MLPVWQWCLLGCGSRFSDSQRAGWESLRAGHSGQQGRGGDEAPGQLPPLLPSEGIHWLPGLLSHHTQRTEGGDSGNCQLVCAFCLWQRFWTASAIATEGRDCVIIIMNVFLQHPTVKIITVQGVYKARQDSNDNMASQTVVCVITWDWK